MHLIMGEPRALGAPGPDREPRCVCGFTLSELKAMRNVPVCGGEP
jgi:hypothetical protein